MNSRIVLIKMTAHWLLLKTTSKNFLYITFKIVGTLKRRRVHHNQIGSAFGFSCLDIMQTESFDEKRKVFFSQDFISKYLRHFSGWSVLLLSFESTKGQSWQMLPKPMSLVDSGHFSQYMVSSDKLPPKRCHIKVGQPHYFYTLNWLNTVFSYFDLSTRKR